jgi:uncharacterized membrane protein
MRETSKAESLSGLRRSSFLVPAAAALVLSVGVLIPQTYVRAAIVFPVALLLPGYAILVLAFGPNRRLDWVPSLSLSALLSMAFYPLAGLILAAASIALSTKSIVGAVDVLVAAALAVSFLRSRPRTEPPNRATWLPAEPPHSEPVRGINGKRMLILTAAALVLAGLGLVVALHFEPKAASPPYSAFYLTGAWSHLSAPVAATGGTPLRLLVGVTNRTNRLQTYQIEPQVDGAIAWPTRSVTLLPGDTWSGPILGKMPRDRGLHELIVTLTMEPQAAPVGTLTIWLRSTLPY